MENKVKQENRDTLKKYFKEGNRPTATNFATLIDSMINKADDGISKTRKDGLILAPENDYTNVISFTNEIGPQSRTDFSIALKQGTNPGLGFDQLNDKNENETRLFFNKNGRIGIHQEDPKTNFDVKGIFGAESRIGTYKMGNAEANGKWQTIADGLNGSMGFEIMAHVGKEKSGKHALLHAFAFSTFGRSRSRIRYSQAHYGWWWNKLRLRWRGDTFNYRLEIKSRSDYGSDQKINFCVTKLWDSNILELIEQQTKL